MFFSLYAIIKVCYPRICPRNWFVTWKCTLKMQNQFVKINPNQDFVMFSSYDFNSPLIKLRVVKQWLYFLIMSCYAFTLLYGPFLWIGFNCLKARATSRRQFTFYHKFPEIPGTHFINLGRMKGWVDLGATHWFGTWDPWIGNPAP